MKEFEGNVFAIIVMIIIDQVTSRKKKNQNILILVNRHLDHIHDK